MKKLKLIITADIKEYANLWLKEEITTSRFAELLNEAANKALHKLGVSGKQPDYQTIHAAAFDYSYAWRDEPIQRMDDIQDGFEAGAQWALSQVAGVPTQSDGKAGE